MTLRRRLALVSLVGVLVPLAILVVVAFVSSEETSVSSGSSGRLVERTRALSPWVPITAAVLTVPAAVAAWWWAGRAVAPLRRITEVTDEIQATSLARRIGLDDAPEEVQTLADSFDRMLERLERATEAQDKLVEDASHQLRTPIAVLATTIDVALADPSTDLRVALHDARTGVRRLEGVVDALLADARAARHATARRGNDLVTIVRDAAIGVPVQLRAPERLLAACDGAAVARAVEALLDNAVTHAAEGSLVHVECGIGRQTGLAFIAVTDDGPGIPPEQLGHVFERYWSDRADGLGIGLAVVKQVGESHEGFDVTSPIADGRGTRFTLSFRPDP